MASSPTARPGPSRSRVLLAALVLGSVACSGPALAELVFGPGPAGDLDHAERDRIAGTLGLLPSPDGAGLVDELCGQPAAVTVTHPDPLWRWNGGEYVFDRDEPQAPGGCDNR